jgi:hypothetical protein
MGEFFSHELRRGRPHRLESIVLDRSAQQKDVWRAHRAAGSLRSVMWLTRYAKFPRVSLPTNTNPSECHLKVVPGGTNLRMVGEDLLRQVTKGLGDDLSLPDCVQANFVYQHALTCGLWRHFHFEADDELFAVYVWALNNVAMNLMVLAPSLNFLAHSLLAAAQPRRIVKWLHAYHIIWIVFCSSHHEVICS